MPAADRRAERIAAILYQEQPVLFAEPADGDDIKRIAQRMGDHDRTGARRDRRFDGGDVDIVGGNMHIDEDGHRAGLENRIDSRRKAGRAGDDFVAWLDPARI